MAVPMTQIIVRVPEDVRAWLKSEFERTGAPTAEIVRRILRAEMEYQAKSR